MKVKLKSGVEYWVSWMHNNNTNSYKTKHLPSSTECTIQNQSVSALKGVGLATMSKLEKQFNKDVGRKISLKKAMTDLNLNKTVRTLFWNEYFKMTNNEKT